MNASSNWKPPVVFRYLQFYFWTRRTVGGKRPCWDCYLLLSALISMFPSLMRSLMNLFVRSSSISWHLRRSLKSGLSRKESLNSKVGSPIVPERQRCWLSKLSNSACKSSYFSSRSSDATSSSSSKKKKLFLFCIVPHFRFAFFPTTYLTVVAWLLLVSFG